MTDAAALTGAGCADFAGAADAFGATAGFAAAWEGAGAAAGALAGAALATVGFSMLFSCFLGAGMGFFVVTSAFTGVVLAAGAGAGALLPVALAAPGLAAGAAERTGAGFCTEAFFAATFFSAPLPEVLLRAMSDISLSLTVVFPHLHTQMCIRPDARKRGRPTSVSVPQSSCLPDACERGFAHGPSMGWLSTTALKLSNDRAPAGPAQ
ncbi:MAG: hypothetical protein EKK41_29140 [Hyphomicrobiales bacterium]|nr:MAG: hypothetical protein EKK41_29140 [Hyphomicrobiales bacterium]